MADVLCYNGKSFCTLTMLNVKIGDELKRIIIFFATFFICIAIGFVIINALFMPTLQEYYCTLCVPSARIMVPVFSGHDAQAAVDADNSAAYVEWRSHGVITDHREQAFLELKNVSPGSSLAFLVYSNKIRIYMCDETEFGSLVRKSNQITRVYGEKVKHLMARGDDSIVIYTCNPIDKEGETGILLTYWHRIL